MRRVRRILFWLLGVPLGIALVGTAGFVGYVLYLSWQSPSIDDLEPRPERQNSVVYAATGERLGFIPATELRDEVPGSLIPDRIRQAVVAVEDRRFYDHAGVDYPAIVRAAAKDVTSKTIVQGGSTITMQLVRRLYLTRDRTFKRKIEEATLAKEMEKRRSKDWILNHYLNDVDFGAVGGQSAVGIQAAARVFFGKPARSLNLSQSALLAGLPQAPDLYSPVRHPEAAIERRNQVLRAMARARMIAPGTADRLSRRGLGLHLSRYYTHRRERHFFDFVERELRQKLGQDAVDRGGLRVHTTLDMKLQRTARAAIRHRLYRRDDPASAVVSVDVRTGGIKTMATSARYEREQFDYASQGHRQPGSTFKPVVLLAAVAGHQADPRKTFYVSKPIDMNTGFGRVKVSTYDETYAGRMNLVRATLRSDNSVYQQLDLDVGPDLVADTATDLGIETPLDGLPAEGLGGLGAGVSPLELTRAYTTFASGGERLDLSSIASVDLPGGEKRVLTSRVSDKVYKDGETWQVTRILQRNIKEGTGTKARIGCPAAGKTGTTDDFRDAWFAGYTPRLTTVVWVGYPHRSASMTDVHGIKVAGGTFPAQIWHDYMSVAKGRFCGRFAKPEEKPDLGPYCGRLSVTKNCGPSPVDSAEPGGAAPEPVAPAPRKRAPVPDTAITASPPPQTTSRSAGFRFRAVAEAAKGFECSIDSGPFTRCRSPVEFSYLRPGDHVFAVRALSPDAEPDGTPATYSWNVFEDLVPRKKEKKPKRERQEPPELIG